MTSGLTNISITMDGKPSLRPHWAFARGSDTVLSLLNWACRAHSLDPEEHAFLFKGTRLHLSDTLEGCGVRDIHSKGTIRVKLVRRADLEDECKAGGEDAAEGVIEVRLAGRKKTSEAHARMAAAKRRSFTPDTSVWQVLGEYERVNPTLKLLPYVGVPEDEEHDAFALHIHVPGRMEPRVRVVGDRDLRGEDELQSTKIGQLKRKGGVVKLQVTHEYVPPDVSEEEVRRIRKEVGNKFSVMSQRYREEHQQEEDDEPQQQEEEPPQEDPPAADASPLSDRHLRVWKVKPGRVTMRTFADIPDEFYELTEHESEQQAKSIREEASGPRALQKSSKLSSEFQHATLRFLLPNQLVLEGRFRPSEPIRHARAFVKDALDSPQDVTLFVAPPRTVLNDDETLASLRLVPAALVHVSSTGSLQLRDALLEQLSDLSSQP